MAAPHRVEPGFPLSQWTSNLIKPRKTPDRRWFGRDAAAVWRHAGQDRGLAVTDGLEAEAVA